jgi:hypothetical protein
MTTFTIVLCMVGPVVAIYMFVRARLKAASLKTPQEPQEPRRCWNSDENTYYRVP